MDELDEHVPRSAIKVEKRKCDDASPIMFKNRKTTPSSQSSGVSEYIRSNSDSYPYKNPHSDSEWTIKRSSFSGSAESDDKVFAFLDVDGRLFVFQQGSDRKFFDDQGNWYVVNADNGDSYTDKWGNHFSFNDDRLLRNDVHSNELKRVMKRFTQIIAKFSRPTELLIPVEHPIRRRAIVTWSIVDGESPIDAEKEVRRRKVDENVVAWLNSCQPFQVIPSEANDESVASNEIPIEREEISTKSMAENAPAMDQCDESGFKKLRSGDENLLRYFAGLARRCKKLTENDFTEIFFGIFFCLAERADGREVLKQMADFVKVRQILADKEKSTRNEIAKNLSPSNGDTDNNQA